MAAQDYLGTAGLAGRLGVSRHAVVKWRARYDERSQHPFPAPDVTVDGVPGWSADRVGEIEQWRAGLPGRGTGGGRPKVMRYERSNNATPTQVEQQEWQAAEMARAAGYDVVSEVNPVEVDQIVNGDES